MPDIDLKRLRKLRGRAQVLLSTLVSDLRPFRHQDESFGFRRKPDSESPSGDVNVTTTCSCLMSLALSGKMVEFYAAEREPIVSEIFKHVFGAPWMSSGLTEDNAFTTCLVLRLHGLLVNAGLKPFEGRKHWEPKLQILNIDSLATKLVERKEPFTKFLFDLFPRELQKRIEAYIGLGTERGRSKEGMKEQITAELMRLVRATVFYDDQRFRGLKLGPEVMKLSEQAQDAYQVARLNRLLLHKFFEAELAGLREKSLQEIAVEMSSSPETMFGINEYPPSAAVLYWFVDGVARAGMELPDSAWVKLCKMAADEFGRQRSLVVARHAAMMDPVAMAMSACLCGRLGTISKELNLGMTKVLPSIVELERAVVDLFPDQTRSGIWPKYFPLFHYQDAGSNFCFTFELLEAVLVEFGSEQNHVVNEEGVVAGLERAVDWCEENRLRCPESTTEGSIWYEGWNSGGNLETLRRAQPESWATAVVHMFLRELVDVLSRHIQQRLLDRYSATRPKTKWKKLSDLLDIELLLDGKRRSLKETLSSTIVETFSGFKGERAENLRRTPVKDGALSALLFGPPGTSKTEVTRSIARDLNWPIVEIDPSNFLQDSFQNIYIQAERIFEDVMDLCGVVVLFDEMDALVQKRDAETAVDTESKFLTTYMLPKLSKLHQRGQLVFLMATNFQANFDDAIKRAGRFDFLLCMGPPTLKAKCDSIHVFFDLMSSTEQTRMAGRAIRKFAAADSWVEDQLSLYTYGDFLSFIAGMGNAKNIGNQLKRMKQDDFARRVKDDCQSVSLKLDDLKPLEKVGKWKRLADLDRKVFDEKHMRAKKVDSRIPAIKYVLDRKQTRRQCKKLGAKG